MDSRPEASWLPKPPSSPVSRLILEAATTHSPPRAIAVGFLGVSVSIIHLDNCYPAYLKVPMCCAIDSMYAVEIDDATTREEVYSRLEREVGSRVDRAELSAAITSELGKCPSGGKLPFDGSVEPGRSQGPQGHERVYAHFTVS